MILCAVHCTYVRWRLEIDVVNDNTTWMQQNDRPRQHQSEHRPSRSWNKVACMHILFLSSSWVWNAKNSVVFAVLPNIDIDDNASHFLRVRIRLTLWLRERLIHHSFFFFKNLRARSLIIFLFDTCARWVAARGRTSHFCDVTLFIARGAL
jgi:hypothetical protein